MNKRIGGLVFGAGIAMIAVWAGWAMFDESSSVSASAQYLDADVVAQGAGLYAENCASCHGAKLRGQANWKSPDADGYLPAPPHDETGHTWHHPTVQLFEITKFGTEKLVGGTYKSRMAGYSGVLSDDEIIAVLAYIKSTWPAQVIDQHNQINANAGS